MNNRDREIDESARERFEQAWLEEKPLSIAECVKTTVAESRVATLMELVLIDMEFSWKQHAVVDGAASPNLLETYVEEFPELAEAELIQELLEEEYQIRRRFGDSPRYDEFENRFPDFIQSLDFTDADSEFAGDGAKPTTLQTGAVIDKYTLEGIIGEGGMGRVFAARQSKPIERQVAVKVIKKGFNSSQVVARFDGERQALAMMDHVNIAKIYDGGETPDGQPYFVMEYVDGEALTDYCDRKRLALNDRLSLFKQVCGAVQHAHQKGVLHRDLKPSNVLVAEYDGKPVPKVIDFGLAKALDQQKLLTDKTMETGVGQILGTYRYMSPEQAAAGETDVDTRTDIYALGVILYELLTGSTPLDQKSFKDKALLKVLELIRDHTPQRPSTKMILHTFEPTTLPTETSL